MDSIDTKILEALQENSRISISDLSKKVNLSLSAVSERLKKLEASNIIEKYTVILNSHSLGQKLSVFMSISLIEIGRASVGKECRSRWSPYH